MNKKEFTKTFSFLFSIGAIGLTLMYLAGLFPSTSLFLLYLLACFSGILSVTIGMKIYFDS